MKREWGTRRARLRGPALLGPLVLLLGLCLAVGPGPAAPSATAEPAAAPAPRAASGTTAYKAVTHNVQRKPSAIDRAVAQAKSYGARVLFLQELCLDDFRDLRDQHDDWTFSYQPKGVHTGGGKNECTNERDDEVLSDGVATIWLDGPDGTARQFVLDAQDPQHQDTTTGLACVFYDNARVRACSVHSVSADKDIRAAQHREIRDLTRPWMSAGKLVVLGGDFNAPPAGEAMRPIYASGRSEGGRFREISRSGGRDCRCGSGTHGEPEENRVKFDYLFFSSNAMAADARRAAYALPADFTESDHRMLRGYANVFLPR